MDKTDILLVFRLGMLCQFENDFTAKELSDFMNDENKTSKLLLDNIKRTKELIKEATYGN